MTITASLIILAAAVGSVFFLFASDYYYRHLDSKSLNLPLVKIENSRQIEPEAISQKRQNNDNNIAA